MPPPTTVFPNGMGPPDGGYGWVVAAAYALNNIIIIPIIQNFGLVFRDLFNDLDISGTNTAVIMNLNNAFGLALGLFNGPILRTFSYRKVALLGSLLVFVGMILTSFARSFVEFLVCYGLIMSAGYNLTMASFAYAINTYFRKRRSMAMGFAMTVTGLGPVFMPQVISLCMREYGARSTALLLGALALHSAVGAMLLHPVRWHLVKTPTGEEEKGNKKEQEMVDMSSAGRAAAATTENEAAGGHRRHHDGDDVDDDDFDDTRAPMLAPRRRLSSSVSHRSGAAVLARTTSTTEPLAGAPLGTWASMASIDSDALGGSVVALHGAAGDAAVDAAATATGARGGHGKANGLPNGGKAEAGAEAGAKAGAKAAQRGGSAWRRWLRAVVEFFDLGLLRDPIYVNMNMGLSFAVFAEINFSLLTPFILGDRHFGTQEIATFVSVIAVSDILFRFLAPFIKRVCKKPVRFMYLISLFMLICTRSVFIFCYSFESLIGVMVLLGVAKGLRTVYWVLVIPDYVPIERLPAANGLQSVTNGLVFMALGPLVGVVRDKLGDYNYVIMAINVMTALTIVMWTTEFIIVALRRSRRARVADKEAAADAGRLAKS